MEIRISLSQVDFRALVQGEEVVIPPLTPANKTRHSLKIVLDDIGFQAMTAEVNTARRLVEERERREALSKGRCRFCGKGGLADHAGAARCTACGRLQ